MADMTTDENVTPAHVTVVYDRRDGHVVHVHEFFGERFDADECARASLEVVASFGLATAGLEVLHPPGFRMRPDTTLAVDVKSREVVVTPAPDVSAEVQQRLRGGKGVRRFPT